MTVHWVNYDLNKTGQNYDGLITYLKSHLSWAKPAKSSFFVKSNLSAGQLRDGIKAHLDGNDAVTVVAVTGQDWATMGVSKVVTDWMKANIQTKALRVTNTGQDLRKVRSMPISKTYYGHKIAQIKGNSQTIIDLARRGCDVMLAMPGV